MPRAGERAGPPLVRAEAREGVDMAKGKKLTSKKAKKILRDGSVRGHKLSPKQKKFFGAVAGGQKPRGKKR
jgi:hypothetical protein